MQVLSHVRFRCVLLAAALLAITYFASARERGPRVEVVCPFAPVPSTIGAKRVLAYELHVTNFDKVPLTLTNLDVYAGSDQGRNLQARSGEELSAMMVDVGAEPARKITQVIAPGERVIVFMWVELAPDEAIPQTLVHRMVFRPNPSTQGDTGENKEAVLNNFPVAVSRRSVPVLEAPFRDGIWVAGDGPANDSPHRRSLLAIGGHVYQPERYASDWVKVGANGDSKHGTKSNDDYWDYSEPVLAVADGEVTRLMDGIPDNVPHVLPKQVTLDNILGNYVTLRIAPSTFVTYAHLRNGSIKVALHQSVKQGDILGLVGDSGQATAPHLHLEVTDGNSGLESEGIPFVFSHYTDLGPGTSYEQDKHPTTSRTRDLPEKDEVVEFTAGSPAH